MTRMILPTIFSNGCPCFSYIASIKKGSITNIMHRAAVLFPAEPRSRKNSGTPKSAPPVKQTNCRLVKLKATLVFDFGQVFGYRYIGHRNSLLYENETELSTSLPHTSQPGVACLANSSIRGKSPISCTIRSLTSCGFLECSSI